MSNSRKNALETQLDCVSNSTPKRYDVASSLQTQLLNLDLPSFSKTTSSNFLGLRTTKKLKPNTLRNLLTGKEKTISASTDYYVNKTYYITDHRGGGSPRPPKTALNRSSRFIMGNKKVVARTMSNFYKPKSKGKVNVHNSHLNIEKDRNKDNLEKTLATYLNASKEMLDRIISDRGLANLNEKLQKKDGIFSQDQILLKQLKFVNPSVFRTFDRNSFLQGLKDIQLKESNFSNLAFETIFKQSKEQYMRLKELLTSIIEKPTLNQTIESVKFPIDIENHLKLIQTQRDNCASEDEFNSLEFFEITHLMKRSCNSFATDGNPTREDMNRLCALTEAVIAGSYGDSILDDSKTLPSRLQNLYAFYCSMMCEMIRQINLTSSARAYILTKLSSLKSLVMKYTLEGIGDLLYESTSLYLKEFNAMKESSNLRIQEKDRRILELELELGNLKESLNLKDQEIDLYLTQTRDLKEEIQHGKKLVQFLRERIGRVKAERRAIAIKLIVSRYKREEQDKQKARSNLLGQDKDDKQRKRSALNNPYEIIQDDNVSDLKFEDDFDGDSILTEIQNDHITEFSYMNLAKISDTGDYLDRLADTMGIKGYIENRTEEKATQYNPSTDPDLRAERFSTTNSQTKISLSHKKFESVFYSQAIFDQFFEGMLTGNIQ